MADEEDSLLSSIKDDMKAEKESTKEGVSEVTEEDEEDEEDKDVSGEGEEVEAGDESKDKNEVEEVEDQDVEEDHQPTRGETRQQRLANQLKQEREERVRDRKERDELIADRAKKEAELDYYRKQRENAKTDSDRIAEEERLALLDPAERSAYQANQRAEGLERRLNQMQMQMAQNADRDRFNAKASTDPTYGKYASQVEEMFQDGLRRGVNVPREELHSLILGRELKKDMAKKLSQKKDTAKKRIDTVTSKPASARGDVAGSKKGKSEEDRLRGVLI